MKPLDHSFRRLLKAAAQAPAKAQTSEPPYSLETATLAHWRSAAAEDEWTPLARLFQRAVICSSLIMMLSVGWTWLQTRNQDADATELAGYAMTIQLPP